MNSCRSMLRGAAIAVAAFSGLGALPAQGQEEIDTYGTATTTNHVLQAYAFVPFTGDGATFIGNGAFSRGCLSPCNFEAAVMLPAGSVIESMDFEACDTSASAEMTAALVRQPQLEGAFTTLAFVSTGVAATPGCAFFPVTLTAPHTVNNRTSTYIVQVQTNGTTIATRFQAVRIVYRLQVSAAPAVATFPNDVPTTHPFFRFVEALAAAGITGGCGPGAYCPDSAVTRGQMAVFLATALGLHFPN